MKCLEHYLTILVYSFYCQFFEPVTKLTKTMLLFVNIKLHKTTEMHIQIFVLMLKLMNHAKQYEEKQIQYFVWPSLTLYRDTLKTMIESF